jgi:[ribosomal protein S5]-alanine N-acetyltransferase
MTSIQINPNLCISEFEPEKDKSDLIFHINDLDVYKNTLTIPHPYTEVNAYFYFNLVKELDIKHGKPTTFAIRYDGKLIGGIGRLVSYGLESHKDEIGYYLGKDFRNKGIMTQVVVAFCDFLHQKQGLIRIEAGVFLTNPNSMSVLRKAGFEEEGMLRKYHKKGDEYKDVLLFSKIF